MCLSFCKKYETFRNGWDSERQLLAIELSLAASARDFWVASNEQQTLANNINDVESQLIITFYKLNNEVDRQLLTETMKQKPNDILQI